MKVHWKPQPKQSLALASTAEEILYGGARGGGKTEAGQAFLLYDYKNPRYRALVIRKNADDLRDWLDRAMQMYKPLGAEQTGVPAEIRFPSGAIIRTGHLKDDKAYTKYQGQEYQKMLIEELSHIARKSDYKKLIGSCRSTVDGIKPQVFCTTNPDEPGLEWIKEHWQIPDVPDFDQVYSHTDEQGRRLVFVPAKVEDNPILLTKDPNYLKYLEGLKRDDPDLYEAWRHGNWKGYGVEGAYYRNQTALAEEEGRIRDVTYNDSIPVDTWWDLGMNDSTCIGFFQQVGTEWHVIDYYEAEGEGLAHYARVLQERGYVYGQHWAPHDIAQRELGTGVSRQDTARSLGLNFQIAPKLDVQDGIDAVRMRFRSLWFDKNKCEVLLQRLRRYHKEFDEKRGVYKNNPYHDINSHAADMMRYWATTRTSNEVFEEDFSLYKAGYN